MKKPKKNKMYKTKIFNQILNLMKMAFYFKLNIHYLKTNILIKIKVIINYKIQINFNNKIIKIKMQSKFFL